MPTEFRTVSGRTGVPSGTIITAAEYAFYERGDVIEWWEGRHRQGLGDATGPAWLGRKSDMPLAPLVEDELPSVVAEAGPDDSTVVKALTSVPSGALITPADQIVVPLDSDWTIFGVTKNGSTTTAGTVHVPGDSGGGGGIDVHHRSSNRLACYVRDGDSAVITTGGNSNTLSVTATSSTFTCWMLCWQQSTGSLALWTNGAAGAANNGLASTTGLSMHDHSQRLQVCQALTISTGETASSGAGTEIALIGVASVYAPGDSGFRAALKALINAIYPSITMA